MSIVLVVGVAVAMSACGARSSLPVPLIVGPNSIIAYASFGNLDGDGQSNPNSAENIWVINAVANGFVSLPLTHLDVLKADSDEPVWSPDGSKIAFASVADPGGSDQLNTNSTENIWVIDTTADNVQGFTSQPLTHLMTSGAESEAPAWSPNGTMIAFASNRSLDGKDLNTNGAFNIWVVNTNDPNGSSAHPVTGFTAIKGFSSSPVWSPDGSQIAFASNQDLNHRNDQLNINGTSNIWVVNANDLTGLSAHPLTKLTAAEADSFNPVWSPVLPNEPTKIAFNSRRDLNHANDQLNINGTANIWVINANDLTGMSAHPLTKLTASLANSLEPAWSPNGSQIAFASSRDPNNISSNAGNGAFNIWVINANDLTGLSAHPLTKLTATGADSRTPAWQGGSQIVFASSRALDRSNTANGTSNIWMINTNDTNGSSAQPLTNRTNGDSFTPSVRK